MSDQCSDKTPEAQDDDSVLITDVDGNTRKVPLDRSNDNEFPSPDVVERIERIKQESDEMLIEFYEDMRRREAEETDEEHDR